MFVGTERLELGEARGDLEMQPRARFRGHVHTAECEHASVEDDETIESKNGINAGLVVALVLLFSVLAAVGMLYAVSQQPRVHPFDQPFDLTRERSSEGLPSTLGPAFRLGAFSLPSL